MPRAPDRLELLPAARDDLAAIRDHNEDHYDRIIGAIEDWTRQINWGRVPQDQLTYLTGSGPYNFYREWVGRSGYRVIYEISGDVMTVVAVLPKDEDTYDLEALRRRIDK